MSIGPRDRVVESLLRGSAPAEPSADCLDAELLAAWVDGGLDPESTARAEAHVSNCAYCQTVVASMIHVSDAIGANASLDGAAERPWWQLNIRWLVPILGAATAGLLWMVVPSQPPSDAARDARVQNESLSRATEPSAAADAVQSPAERRRSDAPSATSPANAAEPAAPQARPAPTQPPTLHKQVDRQERDQAGAMAKAEAPSAREEQARAGRRTAAEPLSETVAPPAAPPPPPAVGGLGATDAVQNRAFAGALPTIASRDAAVQWRVRNGSIVERSVDGGRTWMATEGNAGTGVLAGASPAADVCWLVGRDGLVLVTRDARTWRRATAPVAESLVGVDATDDRRATVRTAAGAAYETDDGGATWRRGQ